MANIGRSFEFLLNQLRAYQGSLAGGTVEFYNPNSTNLTTVYLDINLQIIAANPYMLSADGQCELFGNGTYRVVVKNAAGVIVFDWDYIECIPTPDPGSTGPVTGGTGSVHTVVAIPTNGPDQNRDLTADYNQYWTRTGDNLYVLNLVPPVNTVIYGRPAGSPFTLYSDGETVAFLLNAGIYYPIIG